MPSAPEPQSNSFVIASYGEGLHPCYGAVMANDDNEKDRPRVDVECIRQGSERNRRPFDTSGVNWVPENEDDDPPYRDWWVVGEEEDDE